MATLLQKFLIRARRNGLSTPVLALGAVGIIAVSAGVSGLEGVLFTMAIGMAYLLGTATREGPFHLRSLAKTPLELPVSRAVIEARIAHDLGVPPEHGQSLALVLALDGYEELIERHGRRAISQIKKQIALRLYGEIRHNDTLAALGRGMFAVYMPPNARLDLENAVQTAMRLHAATSRPVAADGLRLHLTSCIGFCVSGRLAQPASGYDLLTAAEVALESAQKEGPRTVRTYDHTLSRAAKSHQSHTNNNSDVLSALHNGQIHAWYQPQICADTGALTGLEALARWHHPDQGMLAPAQFLDSIRTQGLSVKLTEVMIHQAVEQLSLWDSAGVYIPRISVNLGPEDLANPSIVDRITWALDRHSMPAARFGVEVLESVVAKVDPDDMTARNLLALGNLGCLIDLDDFGTGSASINGIRRFAVGRIKIDRSLITALDTDPDQHAMVAAILTMATQLNIDVLAEGVETPGEHSTLAQMGCNHIQGFAIARPMPAADLLAWLLRRAETTAPLLPTKIGANSPKSLRRDAPHGGIDGKTA